jgi:peptidoglycan/LPS O-acetylase OafA/YrhL
MQQISPNGATAVLRTARREAASATAGPRAESAALAYRPDIDGLRAIAVLPVVLFHFRIAPFTGGFIGVDIFFLISGFLICSLIYKGISSGTFSLVEFYERRARRIFPALFTVILFTALASFLLLIPEDLVSFGKSLGATAIFSSNFEFLREAGYFDTSADFKPLLHTWSLAVEEQFYLLFPLLMMLVARRSRGAALALIAVLAAASLGLGLWLLRVHHPSMAFYLAPSRAWELALGAMLALANLAPPRSRIIAELLCGVGLALIAWSLFAFSSRTPFPAANALLSCGGAVLLLHAGAVQQTWSSRLLSAPPMAFVGRISYSLYLWHWPVFVFANYVSLGALTLVEKGALIALSIGLAALSARFVERPFRGSQSKIGRKTVFALSGVAVASTLAVAGLAVASHGLPRRMPPDVRTMLAETSMRADPRCFGALHTRFEASDLCVIGHGAAGPDFLLWGDSLVTSLAPAIEQAASAQGRRGYVAEHNSCAPLPGVVRGSEPECLGFNNSALKVALSPQVKEVILVGRWALAAEGVEYGHPGDAPDVLSWPRSRVAFGGDNHAVFAPALEGLVAKLRAAGKVVVLVHSSPEIGKPAPQTLAKARLFGRPVGDLAPTHAAYLNRQAFVMALVGRLQASYGLRVVRPDGVLCTSVVCPVEEGGRPLYRDDHHLSRFGAMKLAPLLRAAM